MKNKIETITFLIAVLYVLLTAATNLFESEWIKHLVGFFQHGVIFFVIWLIGRIAINTEK